MKFLKCEKCNTILGCVDGNSSSVVCCGDLVKELVPNTVEASGEKHMPIFEVSGNTVNVMVGSVLHPMSQEHHIAWVAIETAEGFQRKQLDNNGEPKVSFALTDGDHLKAVYAYCNLHGLWKSEL
ncbi:MAG: desulfoferrodoxin family protein [Christensenellales bacterium]